MDKDKKLIELKNLVEAAEISLQQARQLLVSLVGSHEEKILAEQAKKTGVITAGEEGQVIEGVFDGQNMVGPDEKKYSVPANYASKSRLIEGDSLKLTIRPDGSFVYKQINLLDRDRVVGQLSVDEKTNEYRVLANNKAYKVLTASITYYKGETGDSVTILVPKGRESTWAAVENIFKPGQEPAEETAELSQAKTADKDEPVKKEASGEFLSQEENQAKPEVSQAPVAAEDKVEDKPLEEKEATGQAEDIFSAAEKVETDDVKEIKEVETQVKDDPALDSQIKADLNKATDNQGLEEL